MKGIADSTKRQEVLGRTLSTECYGRGQIPGGTEHRAEPRRALKETAFLIQGSDRRSRRRRVGQRRENSSSGFSLSGPALIRATHSDRRGQKSIWDHRISEESSLTTVVYNCDQASGSENQVI